jgi:peroxiredoxin
VRGRFSDSALVLLLVLLLLGMIGFHVQLKKPLDTDRVEDVARTVRDTRRWLGRTAPNFKAPLSDKSRFELADHVGKQVVILNFFASWCMPCRQEMPLLTEFWTREKAAGRVLLVGVDSEATDVINRFAAQQRINFPVIVDFDRSVERAYGVANLPTTVVIGVDGKVKVYEVGAIRNAEVAFSDALGESAALLAASRGITREEYLHQAALEATPEPGSGHDGPPLEGRRLAIAESMSCPCGCDHKLLDCSCRTAKNVKKRLATMTVDGVADDEVVRQLNKEFCMKGMS